MEIVEGKIRLVMESWPIQLVIDTPSGKLNVSLNEETKVVQEGRHVEPSSLFPGGKVRLSGRFSPDRRDAFSAAEILILSS